MAEIFSFAEAQQFAQQAQAQEPEAPDPSCQHLLPHRGAVMVETFQQIEQQIVKAHEGRMNARSPGTHALRQVLAEERALLEAVFMNGREAALEVTKDPATKAVIGAEIYVLPTVSGHPYFHLSISPDQSHRNGRGQNFRTIASCRLRDMEASLAHLDGTILNKWVLDADAYSKAPVVPLYSAEVLSRMSSGAMTEFSSEWLACSALSRTFSLAQEEIALLLGRRVEGYYASQGYDLSTLEKKVGSHTWCFLPEPTGGGVEITIFRRFSSANPSVSCCKSARTRPEDSRREFLGRLIVQGNTITLRRMQGFQ